MSFYAWWPFDAHTPVLKSYDEFKRTHQLNMHRDTKTVTERRFNQYIDFRLFPQVRTVTAAGSVGVLKVLRSLEAEPQGWPDFKSFYFKYNGLVEQRLNDFNRKYARNIRSINCDATLVVVFSSISLSPVCMAGLFDYGLTPAQCDMNRECDIEGHL
jgi:hypothetical protein